MKDIGEELLRNFTLFFNAIYNGSSNILHHTKIFYLHESTKIRYHYNMK